MTSSSEQGELRLDSGNVLRCTSPRSRGRRLECDTPLARPSGPDLVIRCRNCHTDHRFTIQDQRIVPASCRLPEEGALS